MQKGILQHGASSLGYYTFRIKDKTQDAAASVVLSLENPVTIARFDRDMARLQKIMTGKEQGISR